MPDVSFREWVQSQVEKEPYWFHRIELFPGFVTPGWSDPRTDKLPYFGLPADLTGKRILDIGCAEGFFSFEAERRGAKEVVAIDSYPSSVRRFDICRNALGFKTKAFLSSVYDLNPRSFGTFDVVFFFGVLYHLRNPILALEKILTVCTGTMLLQTLNMEIPSEGDTPLARFYPCGIPSGPPDKPVIDPTVFWVPNAACARGMVERSGFRNVELLPSQNVGVVLRAEAQTSAAGVPPDRMIAPGS